MRILLELFVCGLNYIACFDNIFNWSIVHDLPFKGRLLPVVSRVFTEEYKVILFPSLLHATQSYLGMQSPPNSTF